MLRYAVLITAVAFLVVLLSGAAPLGGHWHGYWVNEVSKGWQSIDLYLALEGDVLTGEVIYPNPDLSLTATYPVEGRRLGAWRWMMSWQQDDITHHFTCVVDIPSLLWQPKAFCQGKQEHLKLWHS